MRIILLSLVVCLGVAAPGFASNYELDDQYINLLFDQSEDQTELFGDFYAQRHAAMEAKEADLQIAALIAFGVTAIRWGSIAISGAIPVFAIVGIPLHFAAIFPWHRYYLGMGDESLRVTALYCLTWGWCGNWHHVVDGVMILVDDDPERFEDNPNYIMWKKT